jgi:hypothetical protein
MMAKSSAILRGRVTQRRHSTKRDFDRAAFRIWRSVAKSNALRYAIPLSVVALVAFPLAAQSQVVVPSQVTPENLRPAAPSAPGPPQISRGEPLKTPAGAESLSFIVGHVAIEGAFPELDGETRAFVHAVQGHRVSVAHIYELANAMEEAYARAGYVLARVTVPEQKLNSGTMDWAVGEPPLQPFVTSNMRSSIRHSRCDSRFCANVATVFAHIASK